MYNTTNINKEQGTGAMVLYRFRMLQNRTLISDEFEQVEEQYGMVFIPCGSFRVTATEQGVEVETFSSIETNEQQHLLRTAIDAGWAEHTLIKTKAKRRNKGSLEKLEYRFSTGIRNNLTLIDNYWTK